MDEAQLRNFTINFGARGCAARRSSYRASPSRHRADRAQDLPAGATLFRPARLRRADESGTCLLSRSGEAPLHRGARSAAPRGRMFASPRRTVRWYACPALYGVSVLGNLALCDSFAETKAGEHDFAAAGFPLGNDTGG